MQVRPRLFAVLFVSFCVSHRVVQAQTPATGSVTISGSLQGPIYPCGNSSCPTYDSGQVTITVNGFNATTNYSKSGGQTKPEQLASSLAAKLSTATSPVIATVSKTKVTITSRAAGQLSNYPLSTLVTYNTLFPKASFTATPSGLTLTAGTRRPVAIGTRIQQTSHKHSA